LKDRLVTEIQGLEQLSIFQYHNQLLAQQQRQSANIQTSLLATDLQRSILHTLDTQKRSYTYTPYGHNPRQSSGSALEFNGERCDLVTRHYLLGNGYRAFNPRLMQFNSPDTLSPFDKGGLNAYAYCLRNPVNFSDPSGHFVAALLSTLTTKVAAVLGAGISIAGGLAANAVGVSRGWVNVAAASGMTSAAVAGVVFSPAASLAVQQVARPIALGALAVGSTVAARAITPVIRNVVSNVAYVSQRLGQAAIESDLAIQLMQSPPARRLAALRRGLDLPIYHTPSRTVREIRS
jgi:RHS repeat-associated protein